MTTTMLEAAKRYAAHGLRVFLVHGIRNGACTCSKADCKSPGKHPATANGFKDATTDPRKIAEWFDGPAGIPYNIGIATQGLLVLDIDRKPGKPDGLKTLVALMERHGKLPSTLTAKTANGGAHMVYRLPAGKHVKSSAGKLGPSLDVRADGGYIVAWPSVGTRHGYEWLDTPDGAPDFSRIKNAPELLIELCALEPTTQATAKTAQNNDLTSLSSTSQLQESDANVARVRSALSVISADCPYDDWRNILFALKATGWGCAYELACGWSATAPCRFDESALKKLWDSARADGGIGIGSLFHAAQAAGWVDRSTAAPAQAAATPSDAEAQMLAGLAALSPLEYDRVRIKRAEALGIRVSTLDEQVERLRDVADDKQSDLFPDVEPWPTAVNGAALLTEIAATVRRFIACDIETAHATALWCAMTWLISTVHVAPLAVITAPEKRCGKTQLLNVIGKLAYRPLPTSNATGAALFRAIEKWGPTVLIDEVDTFMRENEELRGIVNSGHTRDTAFVLRTVGDAFEPRQFSTWGAKALCGIGNLPETIMDRAVVLRLRRKLKTEHVERLRHAAPGSFDILRRKLARWTADNADQISRARPDLPNALHDRAQDNWEPLLAIADATGGDWPVLARRAASALSSTGEVDATRSRGVELLADIRNAFEQRKASTAQNWDRLSTSELLGALCLDSEAPWATYNRGKEMTPRQLANRLREYHITSKNVRLGTSTPKGYEYTQFCEAFERYLTDDAAQSAGLTPSDTPSSP